MDKVERAKIIKILPELDIRMVLTLFGADLVNSRYRVTSDFVDNAALEIKSSEPLPEGKDNAFLCKNEPWTDFKTSVSGRGAFNFLKFLLGIERSDFSRNEEVYSFIKDNFLDENYQLKNEITAQATSYKGLGKKKKEDFTPPEREDEFLQEGIDYLVKQRGIPLDVVQKNMNNEQGTIYVAKVYGWDKSVIFKGYSNGERRSINGVDKTSITGSMRDISGYEVVGEPLLFTLEKTVDENGEESQFIKKGTGRFALTEAAIDALSYRALFPDSFAISLNGVGNFQLAYKKAIGYLTSDMGISIRVAFDNDPPGDKGAQKLFNAIYLRLLFNKKFENILKKHFAHLNNEEDPEGWKKGVDGWLLAKDKISFKQEYSPHLMFFNNPFFQEKYPVHYEKVENGKTVIVKTDEFKLPTISFYVDSEIANLLKIPQNNEIKVHPQSYHKLTSELLVRERPLVYSDWNDALKAQGKKYLDRYEDLVLKNFEENGVKVFPELDDNKSPLSMFRERNPFLKQEHKEIFANYYDNSFPFNKEEVTNQNFIEAKEKTKVEVESLVDNNKKKSIMNPLLSGSLTDLKTFISERNNRYSQKLIQTQNQLVEQKQRELKQEKEILKTKTLVEPIQQTNNEGDFISNAKMRMFKGMSKNHQSSFIEQKVNQEQFNDYSNGNGTIDVEGYLFEQNQEEFDNNNDLHYYDSQHLNNSHHTENVPVELYCDDFHSMEMNEHDYESESNNQIKSVKYEFKR